MDDLIIEIKREHYKKLASKARRKRWLAQPGNREQDRIQARERMRKLRAVRKALKELGLDDLQDR